LQHLGSPCHEKNLRLTWVQQHPIPGKPVSDCQCTLFEILIVRVRFNSNVELRVIGVMMELYAVQCDDVSDGRDVDREEKARVQILEARRVHIVMMQNVALLPSDTVLCPSSRSQPTIV
jgi:hypothetical protein